MPSGQWAKSLDCSMASLTWWRVRFNLGSLQAMSSSVKVRASLASPVLSLSIEAVVAEPSTNTPDQCSLRISTMCFGSIVSDPASTPMTDSPLEDPGRSRLSFTRICSFRCEISYDGTVARRYFHIFHPFQNITPSQFDCMILGRIEVDRLC